MSVIHAGDWTKREEKEFDEKFERLALLESKIKFLVNPKEDDHSRLVDLLAKARNTLGNRAKDSDNRKFEEWTTLYNQFVPLTQSILKREWERVKRTQ